MAALSNVASCSATYSPLPVKLGGGGKLKGSVKIFQSNHQVAATCVLLPLNLRTQTQAEALLHTTEICCWTMSTRRLCGQLALSQLPLVQPQISPGVGEIWGGPSTWFSRALAAGSGTATAQTKPAGNLTCQWHLHVEP